MHEHGSFDRQNDIARGHAAGLILAKARQLALNLGLCDADEKDIAQTLRLEALRRSKAFNSNQGDWKSFIRVVVERRCLTLGRKYHRSHRNALVDGTEMGAGVSRADLFRRIHRGAAGPEVDVDIRIDVRAIVNRMSDQDRSLCGDLGIESISETARRQGVARSTVQDQITKLKKTFKSLNPDKNSPLNGKHGRY